MRMAILNNNYEIALILSQSNIVNWNFLDIFGRNYFHLLLNQLHTIDIDTKLLSLLLSNNVHLNTKDI